MKKIFYTILLIATIFPDISFALTCSDDVTVVYVNGMFAESEEYVKGDKNLIRDKYMIYFDSKDVTFDYAFNPSRGNTMDLLKSVMQSRDADGDVGGIPCR